MIEQDNSGQLAAFRPDDFGSQKEEFKRVFIDVIAPHIQSDRKILEPKAPREQFFKRRVPVYIDALKRGHPVIMQRLLESSVRQEFPSENAFKEIQLTPTGSSRWKIEPQSGDPFEIYRFRQRVEAQGVEIVGELEVWQDPYILDLMVKTGRSQQQQAFSNWYGVYRAVIEREAQMSSTGQYQFMKYFYDPDKPAKFREESAGGWRRWTATDTLMFQDVKAFARGFSGLSDTALQEAFIEKVVVPQGDLSQLVTRVGRTLRSLEGLESLFLKYTLLETEVSVAYNERVRAEDTFLVELFTNPRFLNSRSNYSRPTTTPERLEAFYGILRKLNQDFSADAAKGIIWHLVESTLAQVESQISQIFKEQNIDLETGILYLKSMLIARLNHHLDKKIYLSGADRAIFAFSSKDSSKTSEELAIAESIADRLLRYKFRNWISLFACNAQYTSEILDKLIEYPKEAEWGERKVAGLSRLLSLFGTRFNPELAVFEFGKVSFYLVDESTHDKFRRIYLGKLADAYERGNEDVMRVIDHKVIGSVFADYLRDSGFGLKNPNSRLTEKIVYDRLVQVTREADHTLPREDRIAQIAEHIALLGLNDYFTSRLESPLEEVISERILKLKADNKFDLSQLLESEILSDSSITTDQFLELVTSKAQQVIDKIWWERFGKIYGMDKRMGMVQIMGKSLTR